MQSELLQKLNQLRAVHEKTPQEYRVIDRKPFLTRGSRSARACTTVEGTTSAAVLNLKEAEHFYWHDLAYRYDGEQWAVIRQFVRRAMGLKPDKFFIEAEKGMAGRRQKRALRAERRAVWESPVIIHLAENERRFLDEICWRWGLIHKGWAIREMILDSMAGDFRNWYRYSWPHHYGRRYHGGKLPAGRGEL
jgi:hypothetical protein